jgi:hypothetical protein
MMSHELLQTITHLHSRYIRAIGFLFICVPVEQELELIELHFQDDTEFAVEAQGKLYNLQIGVWIMGGLLRLEN